MADDEKAPAGSAKFRRLTDGELAVARDGPAIYANRVLINMEAVVRIAFVEQSKDGPIFRAAIALPHQTAIELANILKGMLAEIEADLERFRTEAEAEAKARGANYG